MEPRKAKIMSVAELEALMRAGEMATVSKLIQQINRNQVSRSELLQYANIANRVDLGRVAHRFLQPIIRSTKPSIVATDAEKVEYSEALRGMGLIAEARQMLESVDAKTQPSAHLRLSFCLMSQWQYKEAIFHLREYLKLIDPTLYSAKTAQINLAAALVVERHDEEALELLTKLKSETVQAGHQLLYGNCLELLAQLYVLQGNCDLADSTLDEADSSFAQARTRYSLYFRKWRAISKSIRIQAVHSDLLKCREEASQDWDWETLRECDLYIGFLKNDQELLSQVYFGTPYQTYRNRILKLAGSDFLSDETYLWKQCPQEKVSQTLDLMAGKFDSGEEGLEAGQLMHRLLILLSTDFYRPLTVGSAFSELFPDEHYSQTGSSNRVIQIVKRLRSWFAKNGELFSIEETAGSYRLKSVPGVAIRVPREKLELSPQAVILLQLKKSLDVEVFSRNELMTTLNCSQASANRWLRWSLETGQCQAIGAGPQRKYRFAA